MSPSSQVEVRRPRDAGELAAALRLRREVFCEEQGVPPALEVDGRDDRALQVVALCGERVIGTCRVLLRGDTADLGRVAVEAPARRRGIGTALVATAERAATEAGARRVVLHAQSHATGLYAGLGYTASGEPFEEAGIPHLRMEKRLA